MAWTAADVATIHRAIAQGEQRVRFSDGREVQYRSVDELITALSIVEESVANLTSSPVRRVTYPSYSKD